MKGYSTLITINGVFKWKVGKSYVSIRTPNGKHLTPTCSQISGILDWERATYKKTAQIKPSHIIKYLENLNEIHYPRLDR